jgi:hypothetical protein
VVRILVPQLERNQRQERKQRSNEFYLHREACGGTHNLVVPPVLLDIGFQGFFASRRTTFQHEYFGANTCLGKKPGHFLLWLFAIFGEHKEISLSALYLGRTSHIQTIIILSKFF